MNDTELNHVFLLGTKKGSQLKFMMLELLYGIWWKGPDLYLAPGPDPPLDSKWRFLAILLLSGLSEPNGVEKCLICGIDSRNLEMNGSTKANNFDPIH